MTLYLFQNFNNYYNRKLKKYNNVTDYIMYGTLVEKLQVSNFNPRDGVNTSHTVNFYESETPDYCVVCDDEYQRIVSRWYVTEANYNAGGQYKINLYRDVVADYWDVIKDAPCFIEKGIIHDTTNPLILNSENMTFNQIKKYEEELSDASDCPWIVAYVPKDEAISFSIDTEIVPDIIDSPSFEFHDYLTGANFKEFPNSIEWQMKVHVPYTGSDNDYWFTFRNGFITDAWWSFLVGKGTRLLTDRVANCDQVSTDFARQVNLFDKGILATAFDTEEEDVTQRFRNLDGKIIRIGSSYYRIKVNKTTASATVTNVPINSALDLAMQDAIDAIPNATCRDDVDYTGLGYRIRYRNDSITLEELTETAATVTIPTTRSHTQDTPYDILTWPAGYFILRNGLNTIYANKELALNMASAFDNSIAEEKLYDIQILPYCPLQSKLNGNEFDYSDFDVNSCFLLETTEEETIAAVYTVPTAQFTFYIEKELEVGNPKIQSQTDLYRLCSPNYASAFDFNVAKNGGCSGFRVDCAYIPYNPYIHVAPDFDNLYGLDFGDARGLICAGDFSLTRMRNAWQEYELQNKNYQKIFNRQIQNLSVNNNIENIKESVSAAVGTVTGIGVGASMGARTGTISGTALGALAGGALSAGAGIADIKLLQAQQAETLDYTKDLFGYNLGNIKALPDTLTKVSVLNPNNKLIPVLEYYTCTNEELEAFSEKIKYNGMSIGVIGKISDYCTEGNDEYVKGKLIRLENINDEAHMAITIAEEINKGVYV